MKFIKVAEILLDIEKTPSRNEMSLKLADFFKQCTPLEVEIISYLIQGRIAPMFVNSEFNYSEKSIINVLDQMFKDKGLETKDIRRRTGDIGDTVYELSKSSGFEGKNISLEEMYTILWEIVNVSGEGSVSRKNGIVVNCLQKLSPLECKYFARIVCGELRLGLNVRTLLDVFSISKVGDKSLKNILEQAYGVSADIGYIANVVFKTQSGKLEDALENIKAVPGTPILSRLVERVGSFEEVFERFNDKVIVQPKFDGLRCQIHKWSSSDEKDLELPIWKKYLHDNNNGSFNLFGNVTEDVEVRLFTRNLEDVTEMFPEIVDSAKQLDIKSFVLDSEILGWNYQEDKFLSYQETMQRRRKYSVGQKSGEIPVQAMIFDVLYLNGKSLVSVDTQERVKLLNENFAHTPKGISLAESITINNVDELREYFDKCVNGGLEGIIVKQVEGGYRPGLRNYEWVKLKKSMDKTLVDTVDLVVVGYYYGSGRRSGFGLGALLGAVYNEKTDTFDAISKVGTGLTDEQLSNISDSLREAAVDKQLRNIRIPDVLKPDVMVEPIYVITVEADEVTKAISGVKEDIGGGLSLRFPRLIQFGRDKSAIDSTTVEELKKLYNIGSKKSF